MFIELLPQLKRDLIWRNFLRNLLSFNGSMSLSSGCGNYCMFSLIPAHYAVSVTSVALWAIIARLATLQLTQWYTTQTPDKSTCQAVLFSSYFYSALCNWCWPSQPGGKEMWLKKGKFITIRSIYLCTASPLASPSSSWGTPSWSPTGTGWRRGTWWIW